MNNINSIRIAAIAGLTGLAISAAYELRQLGATFGGIPSYVIAVVSLLISATLAKYVIDKLIRSRWARRLLDPSAHVDGYWYLETSDVGDSPLNKDGILFIETDPITNNMKAVTIRLTEKGEEFPTVSEIAYARSGGDIGYLNYFRLTYPGPQPKFGLSSGRFIAPDDLKPYPTLLEAHIVLTGEDVVRRQSAVRIDDEIVNQLQIKHQSRWQAEALKAGKHVILHSKNQLNQSS